MSLRMPLVLVTVLALAACTGEEGPLSNPTTDPNAGGIDPNAGGIVPGSVNDPNSMAYFQQTVGDRVLFDVDQSTINAAGRFVLDNQADFLLRNMEFTAVIEGHADEQGTRDYNLALSARRAASAQEYLISRGIGANRLRTLPLGKERPIAICSAESCYAENRRAVTILAAGPGGV